MTPSKRPGNRQTPVYGRPCKGGREETGKATLNNWLRKHQAEGPKELERKPHAGKGKSRLAVALRGEIVRAKGYFTDEEGGVRGFAVTDSQTHRHDHRGACHPVHPAMPGLALRPAGDPPGPLAHLTDWVSSLDWELGFSQLQRKARVEIRTTFGFPLFMPFEFNYAFNSGAGKRWWIIKI